jgi:hypothetical protein
MSRTSAGALARFVLFYACTSFGAGHGRTDGFGQPRFVVIPFWFRQIKDAVAAGSATV